MNSEASYQVCLDLGPDMNMYHTQIRRNYCREVGMESGTEGGRREEKRGRREEWREEGGRRERGERKREEEQGKWKFRRKLIHGTLKRSPSILCVSVGGL